MTRVLSRAHRILRQILGKIETEKPIELRLDSEETDTLKGVGLLSLDEFSRDELSPEEQEGLPIQQPFTPGYFAFRGPNRVLFHTNKAALRELVETLDGKYVVTENDKEHEIQHGQETTWQEKVKEKLLARRAEIGEATVSTELKTLPEVRESMKALATAQGLHTQELAEQLVVDAINKNPTLVKQGEEYLKRFKGNISAARRYAMSQKLSHLESIKTPSSHSL